MIVVLLVLASAFLHALWNAFLRRAEDKDTSGVVVVLIAALVTAVVAVAAAMTTARTPFPTQAGVWFSLAAGLFEGGYFISLIRGLTAGPLGPVYTISRGGSILVVWPLSALWFGESPTIVSAGASVILCVGLALAAMGRERSVPRRAVLWAASCALFIAGYHLCYKRALAEEASWPAVFAVSLAVATPINVLQAGWRSLPRMARAFTAAPVKMSAIGTMCAASFLLFLLALRDGGAGFVLTLRNTSVLFAVALGAAIGERPTRSQVAGAVLVAAGAVLLGLGK